MHESIHAIAPVKTAKLTTGWAIVPVWIRPWLNVLTIALPAKAEPPECMDGRRMHLFEDYKYAFGENLPMISGLAIMTDTDIRHHAYRGIMVKKLGP